MIDFKSLESFSRKLAAALPPALSEWQADSEKNVRAMVESLLRRLDLVTREEFDVQAALLARTRERLEALDARVKQMEAQSRPNEPNG